MERKFESDGLESTDLNVHTSWSGMVQKIYGDMDRMWTNQSLLIRAEFEEKFDQVKTATSTLMIGGVLTTVGVFAVVATVILFLATLMEPWMAAGIVALVLLVVGGILLVSAKKKLAARELRPNKSLETFGAMKNTFQERIHEHQRH